MFVTLKFAVPVSTVTERELGVTDRAFSHFA